MLVIVDCLTKIVYDEPVKVTIDVANLAKVIIHMIECHYRISESIVID